jgi:signal transduction histidine kinase
MIPNGVLLVDCREGQVATTNKEMRELLRSEGSAKAKEDGWIAQLQSFKFVEADRVEGSNAMLPGDDLWSYLMQERGKRSAVFKSRRPNKQYLQVKTRVVQEGVRLLAVCTDITKVKEFENQARQMRSKFFSSVAHELRTPLNTVIPMVQLVLKLLPPSDPAYERVTKLLTIVYNSSVHLQHVIEDALDITRIENNKFTIFTEPFNLRQVVQEVLDIMQF